MRVGFGYDVHGFADGRELVIGGVKIPYTRGLAGHSDADVLIHAIIDAMIGAAALGDIGRHFPASDPEYKDIPSLRLLGKTCGLIKDRSLKVVNIDSTVVCEAPRLAPHISAMVENIARIIGCPLGSINVKGKTEEGLGFTGSGSGVKAYAVALLDEAR